MNANSTEMLSWKFSRKSKNTKYKLCQNISNYKVFIPIKTIKITYIELKSNKKPINPTILKCKMIFFKSWVSLNNIAKTMDKRQEEWSLAFLFPTYWGSGRIRYYLSNDCRELNQTCSSWWGLISSTPPTYSHAQIYQILHIWRSYLLCGESHPCSELCFMT